MNKKGEYLKFKGFQVLHVMNCLLDKNVSKHWRLPGPQLLSEHSSVRYVAPWACNTEPQLVWSDTDLWNNDNNLKTGQQSMG